MTLGMSRRVHAWAVFGTTGLVFVLAQWIDDTPPRSTFRLLVCVLVVVVGSLYGTFLTRSDAPRRH